MSYDPRWPVLSPETIRRLAELLEWIEWSGPGSDAYGEADCPCCGNRPTHRDDCELAWARGALAALTGGDRG